MPYRLFCEFSFVIKNHFNCIEQKKFRHGQSQQMTTFFQRVITFLWKYSFFCLKIFTWLPKNKEIKLIFVGILPTKKVKSTFIGTLLHPEDKAVPSWASRAITVDALSTPFLSSVGIKSKF